MVGGIRPNVNRQPLQRHHHHQVRGNESTTLLQRGKFASLIKETLDAHGLGSFTLNKKAVSALQLASESEMIRLFSNAQHIAAKRGEGATVQPEDLREAEDIKVSAYRRRVVRICPDRSLSEEEEEEEDSETTIIEEENTPTTTTTTLLPEEEADEEMCTEAKPDCVVCLERTAKTAIVPCGHVCLCVTCSRALTKLGQPCPLCRRNMTGVIRIYSS